MCFWQQNQDINKDQLLEEKHFYITRTLHSSKQEKRKVFTKYKVVLGLLCGAGLIFLIMLKGSFRIFNLINREEKKATYAEVVVVGGGGSVRACGWKDKSSSKPETEPEITK